MDGDGDLDVLSASSTNGVLAWFENTDGHAAFSFQKPITVSALGASAILATDLDGDGEPDVLTGYGDTIAWYKNLIRSLR